MLKRFLLAAMLALVATIGLGASASDALAANCSTPNPGVPYRYGAQSFQLPFTTSCTQVDGILTSESLFIGGCGAACTWTYGPLQADTGWQYGSLPASCATVGGCTTTITTRVDQSGQCPRDRYTNGSYHNGVPYWWGHQVLQIQIHNAVTHTWGSPAYGGPGSGGIYVSC